VPTVPDLYSVFEGARIALLFSVRTITTMSAKRSKAAQRIDEIVANPKTISDVITSIDRLNYILPKD